MMNIMKVAEVCKDRIRNEKVFFDAAVRAFLWFRGSKLKPNGPLIGWFFMEEERKRAWGAYDGDHLRP